MSNTNKLRVPVVSGQFYNSDHDRLKEQVKECFLSDFGPGSLPGKDKKKKIAGAISPHAGYDFSGPAAAHAYKEIAESEMPGTYVIIGPSHMGFPSGVSLKEWETPLGIVKNDVEFGKELSKNGIPVNEEAHAEEHSIEVQLPFLQFVKPKARISAIIAGHDMDFRKIAGAIAKAASSLKRKITVIASSDFTHYGMAYGYVPFSEKIKENIYSLDKGAIDAIKTMEAKNFIKYLSRTNATICGQMPIAVLMETLKQKKARLLKYYTSGDVLGDYTNAVGYASIVFE